MKRENIKRAKAIDARLKVLDKENSILNHPEKNRTVELVIWMSDDASIKLSKDEADMLIVSLLEERSFEYNQLLKELETL